MFMLTARCNWLKRKLWGVAGNRKKVVVKEVVYRQKEAKVPELVCIQVDALNLVGLSVA